MPDDNGVYQPGESDLIKKWFELAWPGCEPQHDEAWYRKKYEASPLLVPTQWNDYNEWTLSNFVARLALSGIQDRLPQWAVIHPDGTVDLNRGKFHEAVRKLSLWPQLLFEIDWGGAPGFSNPEAYYLTYFPIFDRFVVTASGDGPEGFSGYPDQAIGWIMRDTAIVTGVRGIMLEFWRDVYDYAGNPDYAWESIFKTGLVDAATALEWRREIWPDPDDEE
jgi:hypothetical protein